MKRLLFCLFFCGSLFASGVDNVAGYWLIPDEDTNRPESVAYFYESGGVYYARMVLLFDDTGGQVSETISDPRELANGIKGKPKLLGLDFIFNLKPNKSRDKLKGKVVNPDNGMVFDCEVWFDRKKNCLVVRGELFVFGKNNYWKKIPPSEIPKGAQIHNSEIRPNPPPLR